MNKFVILCMALMALSSLVAAGYPGQPGFDGQPGCYNGEPGQPGQAGQPGRYKRQCGSNWNTPPPPTRPPGYGDLLCPKNYWYKKEPSGANCYPLKGWCCC